MTYSVVVITLILSMVSCTKKSSTRCFLTESLYQDTISFYTKSGAFHKQRAKKTCKEEREHLDTTSTVFGAVYDCGCVELTQ